MPRVVTKGDYEGAADALTAGIWSAPFADAVPVGRRLKQLSENPMLSHGEQALVWFARQLFNGDIQMHLANLDDSNRRWLVEVLAGFAGVEL